MWKLDIAQWENDAEKKFWLKPQYLVKIGWRLKVKKKEKKKSLTNTRAGGLPMIAGPQPVTKPSWPK